MTSSFKLQIESANKNCMFFYIYFIKKICKNLNLNYKYFSLPKKIKSFVFLKSPHVYKKFKEHFAIKTFKSVFFFKINKIKKIFLTKILFLYKPTTLKIKLHEKGK